MKFNYKYLWPLKDRVIPDIALIANVYSKLAEGCDILEIAYGYINNIFDKKDYPECIGKGEFYRDFAWLATDFFTTIYNYDTILSDFNTKEITDRYFFGNSGNERCYFPHTATLFHYLDKLDNPMIKIIKMQQRQNTMLSVYTQSGWAGKNIGINIFWNYWPEVNQALPSTYDQFKREAIRKETNFAILFGSVDGLISLRFHEKDSHKYSEPMLSRWGEFSDIPYEVAQDISNESFQSAYDDFADKFMRYVKEENINDLALLCHFNSWIKKLHHFVMTQELRVSLMKRNGILQMLCLRM